MSDYKDIVQAIYEKLCLEGCGTDEYWKLPEDVQYRLYNEALREYADRMADRADYLRKREREEGH